MITALVPGPNTLVQSTIYALPPRVCLVHATTGTLSQADNVAFDGGTAVTLDTNKQAQLAGGFVRCTTGDLLVTLRYM